MNQKPFLAACGLILLLAGQSGMAQQALVRSYENAALEIGQAYLSHYDTRCLAILPTHVADEAGPFAAFLREGTEQVFGESVSVAELGDDVSVADVSGEITHSCGYSTMAVSRAVSSRIKANAFGTLRSINADGSVAQVAVAIVDDDNEQFLRVQPTNDSNQLRKGQSGSLLMSGDTPVGMLLSVDARFGVGKVLRLDVMLDKVDAFLRRRDIEAPSNGAEAATPTPTKPLHPEPAGTIIRWSALPIGAEYRPDNLLATGDSPPWVARSDHWPIEIELELSGDRTAIAGVVLDGRNVPDTGMLPRTIELLISSSESTRRWRSVAGGEVAFVDGLASISIAPTLARYLQLRIGDPANGGDTIALGRLRVVLYD